MQIANSLIEEQATTWGSSGVLYTRLGLVGGCLVSFTAATISQTNPRDRVTGVRRFAGSI
ncbi:MAG TPA: hypothetical protein VKH40_00475 [Alloacidobacterium sp.]|nr:hypothetical protein [Alloacidobacterium sp.]